MKHLEQLGIPNLTSEQIEQLCSIAEETARKHILSKVPQKRIEKLNITTEAEGTKPVTLAVEMDIVLSSTMKDFDVKKLADEAVKKAFAGAEKYLKALKQ